MRRASAAVRDGQRVYASVVGSGVNYDGRTNGITAPSGRAQARLLDEVYGRSRVSLGSVEYLVTHGTGTRLGDPVEINALAEAFGAGTDRSGSCAVTSTKPNIGHTQAASGLVSVVCLALAMRHEVIPPSIHCEQLSDYIRWDDSPFFVNRDPRPWPQPDDAASRYGGVSSFGFSGTNAHVVLESGDTAAAERDRWAGQPEVGGYLLTVSAKTADALTRRLADLAEHLEGHPDPSPGWLAAVSHTLAVGRHHFAYRVAVVATDRDDAARLLRAAADGDTPVNVHRATVARDHTPNPTITRLLTDLLTDTTTTTDPDTYHHHLTAIAELYTQGHTPTLTDLWPTPPPHTTLPTYPFTTDTYWAPRPVGGGGVRLHPLVHANTSDLGEQRYTSVLGDEVSVVTAAGGVLSPGAQVEMAREAIHRATSTSDRDAVAGVDGGAVGGGGVVELWDVVAEGVVDLAGGGVPVDVVVGSVAGGGAAVEWEIRGGGVVACGGRGGRVARSEVERVDLGAAREVCVEPVEVAGRGGVVGAWVGGDDGSGVRLLVEFGAAGDGGGLVVSPAQVDGCVELLRARLGVAGSWSVGAVRFHGVGPASWAVVHGVGADGACGVRLVDGDGVVLTELRDVVVGGVGGVGGAVVGSRRREVMAGWSVAQCVVWELKDAAGQLLKLGVDKLDGSVELRDYGFDSISLVEFAGVLGERFGVDLTPDVFFSFPTLGGLAEYLLDAHGEVMEGLYRSGRGVAGPVAGGVPAGRLVGRSVGRVVSRSGVDEPVAIVGMSGRFPGARSVQQLWSVFAEGRCVVDRGPVGDRRSWGSSYRMGWLPGVAEFDPLFFEISPREAEVMDPRQRLLLMEMWRALEDAGLGRGRLGSQRVGVFVGVERRGDYRRLVDGDGSVTSNSDSILASRLAYFLDLEGPAMAINTSCSSGLVALHEACLSLRFGDCDTAVVAGANLLTDPAQL